MTSGLWSLPRVGQRNSSPVPAPLAFLRTLRCELLCALGHTSFAISPLFVRLEVCHYHLSFHTQLRFQNGSLPTYFAGNAIMIVVNWRI
jgi:hypothetical protein